MLVLLLLSLNTPAQPSSNRIATSSLLSLKPGASLSHITNEFNSLFFHQFTVLTNGQALLCISTTFKQPQLSFYFLFLDERLLSIVEPPPPQFVTKTYKGRPWRQPKPINPEERLRLTFQQPGLDSEALSNLVRTAHQRQQSVRQKESLNVLPAFILTSPIWVAKLPEIDSAVEKASEMARYYNGQRLPVGVSIQRAREVYGEPVKAMTKEGSKNWLVFGKKLPPSTPATFPQVWLSVRAEAGLVTGVFTHDFFNQALISSVPTAE